MKTDSKQILCGIFVSIFLQPVSHADEEIDLVLGGRLLFSSWEGDNNDNSTFKADDGQFGLNATLRKNRLYGGINLQSGTYEFRGNAPDRVGLNSTVSDTNADIRRGELDLFIGYYFWDYVSLFLDIKSVTNDWQGIDYSLNYSGLGGGVTGFYPLNERWTLYGSFGFVPLEIKADSTNFGDGEGSALDVGALFKIDESSNLTIALRNQHQEYDFDNGSKQTHDISGLMVGYSYRFKL